MIWRWDIGNAPGMRDCAWPVIPQLSLDLPNLTEKLALQLDAGFFADRERNEIRNMATQLGGCDPWKIADFLTREMGIAYALMGNFFYRWERPLRTILQGTIGILIRSLQEFRRTFHNYRNIE